MVKLARMKHISVLALALALLPLASAHAETQNYSVISGSKVVGHLDARTEASRTTIDYDVKNNGRGPTMAELIETGADGLPARWDVTGKTTFGSKVEEHFLRTGAKATWTDSTGPGSAAAKGPALYVAQSGSPYSDQI